MLGLDNIERVKPGGLELKDRLVAVNRVTKVTKGGRAFGFSAIVVVGNEDGVIGFGLGKSKGSSNPHNVVKATFKALLDIRRPEEIARMRGVSLSKVFNG